MGAGMGDSPYRRTIEPQARLVQVNDRIAMPWLLVLMLLVLVPVLLYFWRRDYWGDVTLRGVARRRRSKP